MSLALKSPAIIVFAKLVEVGYVVDVDNVYVLCVSGADPDGLCFYYVVWLNEGLCDVCGVSVPICVMYKSDLPPGFTLSPVSS